MPIKGVIAAVFILSVALFLRLYRLETDVSLLLGRELASAFDGNPYFSSLYKLSFSFFGLNPFALRLPGTIVGIFSVALMYFVGTSVALILRLENRFLLGLVAMFLLAISPWHIQVSRTDLGLGLGLFFFVLATLMFYKIEKYRWLILFWVLPAAASFYSDKVFILPIIVVACIVSIYQSKTLIDNRALTVISSLLLAIFLVPFFLNTNPFTTYDDILMYRMLENAKLSELRIPYSLNSPLSYAIYAPAVENIKLFLSNFTSYFQPHTLFFSWVKDQNINASFGLFHPFEMVLIYLGLGVLVKKNKYAFVSLLSFVFFVIFYASFFHGAYSSIWVFPLLPLVVVFSSLGLYKIIHARRKKTLYTVILVVLITFFVSRFTANYYDTPKKESLIDEYEKAFLYIQKVHPQESVIVVDETYGKNLNLYSKLFQYVPQKNQIIHKMYDHCLDKRLFVTPVHLIPKGAKIYYTGKKTDKNLMVGVVGL